MDQIAKIGHIPKFTFPKCGGSRSAPRKTAVARGCNIFENCRANFLRGNGSSHSPKKGAPK